MSQRQQDVNSPQFARRKRVSCFREVLLERVLGSLDVHGLLGFVSIDAVRSAIGSEKVDAFNGLGFELQVTKHRVSEVEVSVSGSDDIVGLIKGLAFIFFGEHFHFARRQVSASEALVAQPLCKRRRRASGAMSWRKASIACRTCNDTSSPNCHAATPVPSFACQEVPSRSEAKSVSCFSHSRIVVGQSWQTLSRRRTVVRRAT